MLIQTTPPAEEPISVSEARVHLKQGADDSADEDGLLDGIWIPAARRHAEAVTNRSFVTQSWRLVLDGFPCQIELERGIVQRIDSLVYRDMGGISRTITWAEPADGIQRSTDGTLVADLSADVARIRPAFGATWPITLPEIGAVAVNYTAGYGSALDVPEGIKAWMLLRIGMLEQNREEVTTDRVAPLPHVDGMLDGYAIVRP